MSDARGILVEHSGTDMQCNRMLLIMLVPYVITSTERPNNFDDYLKEDFKMEGWRKIVVTNELICAK